MKVVHDQYSAYLNYVDEGKGVEEYLIPVHYLIGLGVVQLTGIVCLLFHSTSSVMC